MVGVNVKVGESVVGGFVAGDEVEGFIVGDNVSITVVYSSVEGA